MPDEILSSKTSTHTGGRCVLPWLFTIITWRKKWANSRGGGRSARLVRPSEESITLTIIGLTTTLKTQRFDHKWQDFWSDQGWSGQTGSAGPEFTSHSKFENHSYTSAVQMRWMIKFHKLNVVHCSPKGYQHYVWT